MARPARLAQAGHGLRAVGASADGQIELLLQAGRRQLDALVLEDKPLGQPDADKLKAAMLDGIRQMGLGALPWSDDLAKWRERAAFLRQQDESWPDLSDEALMISLDT